MPKDRQQAAPIELRRPESAFNRKRAISVRFDDDVIARIDALAAKLSAETGLEVSRTACATMLVKDALERREKGGS